MVIVVDYQNPQVDILYYGLVEMIL